MKYMLGYFKRGNALELRIALDEIASSVDNSEDMLPVSRGMKLIVAVCVFSLVACLYVAAKDENSFAMPKAGDAKSYPAHDRSDKEKVTVAADPYDTPNKTHGVFRINYREEGMLPILLVITNEGGQPVALTDMQVELVTRKRAKIQPAAEDDVYRRIAHQPMKGDQPSSSPLPWPRKMKTSLKK